MICKWSLNYKSHDDAVALCISEMRLLTNIIGISRISDIIQDRRCIYEKIYLEILNRWCYWNIYIYIYLFYIVEISLHQILRSSYILNGPSSVFIVCLLYHIRSHLIDWRYTFSVVCFVLVYPIVYGMLVFIRLRPLLLMTKCFMQCPASRNHLCPKTSNISDIPLYSWALVSFSFLNVLVTILRSLV